MSNDQIHLEVKSFLDTIDTFQRELAHSIGYFNKLKTRLDKTKLALKTKPSITIQIQRLITDLQAVNANPELISTAQMVSSLDGLLRAFQSKLQDSFPGNLRQACESARIEFKAMADGFGVGPFEVIADYAKETASVLYAKVAVAQDVPLNVPSILLQVTALKERVIDDPIDLPRFRKDLHEAIRVAVARHEARPTMSDFRSDLPSVFREMCFIRNFTNSIGKRQAAEEYSLARFIIELKQFTQSDDNLKSPQPCRLEPAVIENTRNPKKSIFVPRDAACGYGEGTYYQAITKQQI